MRLIRRLVPVLALVAAPLVFATPAVAVTSLAVEPNSDLVGGQVVALSGSGFTPGAQIGWCQAVQDATPSQSDCGTGAVLTTADAGGNFSASHQLVRFMFVPSLGVTIDCANPPPACVMAAAEVSGISPIPGTVAFAQLQFAPAAPVPPVVVPGGATVAEGSSGPHDVAIPVNLTAPSSQTVTAEWTTIHVPGAPDSQAEPPGDYTPASGTVTFAPGQTTQSVAVSVNGDTEIEPDEYFAVSFSNPTNAAIGGYFGLGGAGLLNDDELPRVVPGGTSLREGDAGSQDLTIPVSLSASSSDTVTVEWTTIVVPGAPGFQAEPPADYTPASGTVIFAPGVTAQSVAVSVNGDMDVEPDEYVVVSFSNPTNATIGGYFGLGGGGITNDDSGPLRVATLNVLHGLFCAPETDFCHAPDRADMAAEGLEDAQCPQLVGFQEVGPRQETTLPEAMSRVCGGRYQLAWQAAQSPDRAMVFTTLPIREQGYIDLAAFPWEAYWVQVDTDLGPVDFLTTHFASSANNPPCDATRCPPICAVGVETNQCNAREVVEFFASRSDATLQIASGDLNARPGSPTLATFTNAGFVDSWLLAGQPECDATSGFGCTGGRPRPDNALDGLDVAEGRYSARIDFVLARADGSCDVRADAEPLFGEPSPEPFRGLYWPSDHAGLIAELRCA